MDLSILYRGPLSSCNYGCPYCPFAKREETFAELESDRHALRRFTEWVSRQHSHQIGVFFTPWGEALIRSWYQRALIELTAMPNVRRAAIQTNLSCSLDWLEECDGSKLGLWCTYHPGETARSAFLKQCLRLVETRTRFSVGIVGLKEHLQEAQDLRAELPPEIYVWVNAYKSEGPQYYRENDRLAFTAIDPLFPINNTNHASFGESCEAGHSAFSVNGEGTMYRCHFIKSPIGNIYEANWQTALQARPCVNETCGCHIGYVHLKKLGLREVFGAGVLERVPAIQFEEFRKLTHTLEH